MIGCEVRGQEELEGHLALQRRVPGAPHLALRAGTDALQQHEMAPALGVMSRVLGSVVAHGPGALKIPAEHSDALEVLQRARGGGVQVRRRLEDLPVRPLAAFVGAVLGFVSAHDP